MGIPRKSRIRTPVIDPSIPAAGLGCKSLHQSPKKKAARRRPSDRLWWWAFTAFRAKWRPVRVKKTRQNKNLATGS